MEKESFRRMMSETAEVGDAIATAAKDLSKTHLDTTDNNIAPETICEDREQQEELSRNNVEDHKTDESNNVNINEKRQVSTSSSDNNHESNNGSQSDNHTSENNGKSEEFGKYSFTTYCKMF